MIGQGIKAAIAPYAFWIKFGGIALVLLLAFRAGCSVQAGRDQARMDRMAGQLREDASALRTVARVLQASSSLLREINAQAEANAQKAAREASELEKAGQVAEQAWQAAEVRAARLANDLEAARRRKPECDALMRGDLEKTCAIKPR